MKKLNIYSNDLEMPILGMRFKTIFEAKNFDSEWIYLRNFWFKKQPRVIN